MTKSKKEELKQESNDHFKITVKEPAERNMANSRIIEILAERYKIPKNKVRIINGHHSPSKILSIDLD